MADVSEGQPLTWLDGEASEPEWPKGEKPRIHLCEGCGKPKPIEAFEAVDVVQTGEFLLLVRCDECRAKPNLVKTRYQVDRAWRDNQSPVEHRPNCNVYPGYSQDPSVWGRGCDCGATARAAQLRKEGGEE